MKLRYCFLSFLFMGWGYYELSGGADFVPETRAAGAGPLSASAASAAGTSAGTAPVPLAAAGAPASPAREGARPGFAPDIVARAATRDLDTVLPPAVVADRPEAEGATAPEPLPVALTGTGRTVATPGGDSMLRSDTSAAGDRRVTAAAATDAPPPPLREVAGSQVNMRAGPGMGHDVLATLPRGTTAQVVGSSNGWAHVILDADGQEGWIAERLLRDAPG